MSRVTYNNAAADAEHLQIGVVSLASQDTRIDRHTREATGPSGAVLCEVEGGKEGHGLI